MVNFGGLGLFEGEFKWLKTSNYIDKKSVSIIPSPDNLAFDGKSYESGIMTIFCDGIKKKIYIPFIKDVKGKGYAGERIKFILIVYM